MLSVILSLLFFLITRRPPRSTRTYTLFPYDALPISPTPSAWRSTCTATASSRRFAPTFPCWTAIPETLRRLSYRYVSFPRHRLRCLPAGPDRHQCRPRQARRYDRRVDSPAHRHSSRSEEHTSELQSLMRISYAVFCLTKKKKK